MSRRDDEQSSLSDIDIRVRALESVLVETRYLVLPMRPAGTDGWDEQRLVSLVNRDCMIGVGLPTPPDDLDD
jgi:nitrile hydratase